MFTKMPALQYSTQNETAAQKDKSQAKMPRDPYPFPRYENDNEFTSHSNLEVSSFYFSS